MSEVKVGDKVKITKPFQGMSLIGARAKVIVVEDDYWFGLDIEGWKGGHDCGVMGEGCASGYWVKAGHFKKCNTFKGNK